MSAEAGRRGRQRGRRVERLGRRCRQSMSRGSSTPSSAGCPIRPTYRGTSTSRRSSRPKQSPLGRVERNQPLGGGGAGRRPPVHPRTGGCAPWSRGPPRSRAAVRARGRRPYAGAVRHVPLLRGQFVVLARAGRAEDKLISLRCCVRRYREAMAAGVLFALILPEWRSCWSSWPSPSTLGRAAGSGVPARAGTARALGGRMDVSPPPCSRAGRSTWRSSGWGDIRDDVDDGARRTAGSTSTAGSPTST